MTPKTTRAAQTALTALLPLLPLLTLGASAFAQERSPASAPAAVAIPASPLKTKKTVQADGLFSVWDSKTKTAKPFFAVKVTLDGPAKYRIDATPLTSAAKKPSFYFSDGVKQYEFNSVASKNGVYQIKDAPKDGQRPMSQLAAMAGLNLLTNPDAAPRAGEERTVTNSVLLNKKAILVTDLGKERKGQDGKTLRTYTSVWIDSATGLPLRKVEGMVADGVQTPNLLLDFAKWTFDQPVPPKTFAWAIPDGATSEREPTTLANGTVAPDFTAYAPDGKPVKLSDYKGKVVVLDFWATWCGPCQQSMPHLEKVYKQVRDKDVVVLAVCVWDTKPEYVKWLAEKKGVYSFPTVFDPAGRGAGNIAGAKYQVTGIPTQYVIGKDGKIAGSTIGYTEGQTFLEDTLQKFGVSVPKTAVAAR